jgi:hypothetical protein
MIKYIGNMKSFICKTEEEIDYIVKKYEFQYTNNLILNIKSILPSTEIIRLTYNGIGKSGFCASMCEGCIANKDCKYIHNKVYYAEKLMREEKLKRILND